MTTAPVPYTGTPTLPPGAAAGPTYGAPPPAVGFGTPGATAPAPGGTPGAVQPPPGFGGGPPVFYPQTQNPQAPYYTQPNAWGGGNQMFAGAQPYLRLISDVGFEYSWLYGSSGTDVSMNNVETFLTFNFPNFLFSPQPLSVTPGFAFHFLDGPAGIAASLPSKVYSGYIDFGWNPRFTERLGAIIDFRAGLYTDFTTTTKQSLRPSGVGLAVIELTPTLQMKLGIEYINRADIKLLPGFGLLWEPNKMTKFDIYFPRPKLAQYLTTLGNTDVWWYVGGEYGGGTWTMNDTVVNTPTSQLVDINDMRVFLGAEWTHPNNLRGHIEIGYVFQREVVYVVTPANNFKPSSTFMMRAGIVW